MTYKNKNEGMLTPKDIEERLNISHGTANKLIHSKAFPIFQMGRIIRIREEDFNTFMETYMDRKFNL